MKRFEGRRFVIAGAGPGAGRAIAVLAASEGARLVIGSRTPQRLEETAAAVRAVGGTITSHVADLTKSTQVRTFFDAASKDLGGAVDAVFCLTGGWHEGGLEAATDEEIERSLDGYLKAALLVNRQAIPHLLKGTNPSLVNFSAAVGGLAPARGSTLYSISKAGITGLTLSLAAELLGKGIRVNAVLPGSISHKYAPGRDYASLRKLGKGPGTPEDVAHAALFLASSEASWVTGATLLVDGGWTVARDARF